LIVDTCKAATHKAALPQVILLKVAVRIQKLALVTSFLCWAGAVAYKRLLKAKAGSIINKLMNRCCLLLVGQLLRIAYRHTRHPQQCTDIGIGGLNDTIPDMGHSLARAASCCCMVCRASYLSGSATAAVAQARRDSCGWV
jgi:hypothetical protein